MSLSDYRQARGLSIVEVAQRVGITRDAAHQLDRNTASWRALTVEQLVTLAGLYGVDSTELLDRMTSRKRFQERYAHDGVVLEAALSDGEERSRDDIARVLGWTLDRTEAAFAALADALRGRGQIITRPAPETYRLIARPGLLRADQRARLNDAHRSETGPDAATADVIRVLADMPNHRAARNLFTRPGEQAAIAELLQNRSLEELDDAIALSPEIAFSIYRRRHPPSHLDSWAASVSRRDAGVSYSGDGRTGCDSRMRQGRDTG